MNASKARVPFSSGICYWRKQKVSLPDKHFRVIRARVTHSGMKAEVRRFVQSELTEMVQNAVTEVTITGEVTHDRLVICQKVT